MTGEELITIHVTTMGGEVICTTAACHDKIFMIKRRLTAAMGVPRFRLQLAFEAHVLDNDDECVWQSLGIGKPAPDPVLLSVAVLPVPDCEFSEEQVEEFKQAFCVFSGTSHATITSVQLGQVLHSLGQIPEREQLQDLISDLPAGSIGFLDFLAWMARNLEELLNDIPEVHKRVNEQEAKLSMSDFSDVSKTNVEGRANVLKMLDEIGDHVQAIVKDAIRFNHYQELLKVEVTAFEDAEDLKLMFAMTAKLWRGLDSWENCVEEWTKTSCQSKEIEPIALKIQQCNKAVLQCEKCMPGNEVVQLWKSAVVRLKNALCIVKSLQNKSLKPTHWEMLGEFISLDLVSEEQELTLGRVMEWKADAHVWKIQEISAMATADES